jgi:periplasmic copper chaperone A
MNLRQLALTVAAALWLATPAMAQSAIQVTGAWARSTPPGAKTAAAYLTVVNTGTQADRLVAVTTPAAGAADVHRTINDNGVMKMRPAGPVDVKPGAPLTLSPGGYHIMMTELKQPLADGQDFPLTLVFEKAGKVEVSVHVQRMPPAGAGSMGGMGGMKMPAH